MMKGDLMEKSKKQKLKCTLGFADKAKLRVLVWGLDDDSILWLYKLIKPTLSKIERKSKNYEA